MAPSWLPVGGMVPFVVAPVLAASLRELRIPPHPRINLSRPGVDPAGERDDIGEDSWLPVVSLREHVKDGSKRRIGPGVRSQKFDSLFSRFLVDGSTSRSTS